MDGEGEPLQEILGASVVSVEAAFYREPRGESADPWLFTILCKPSLEGLRLRSALGSEAVRSATKKREDGGYPPLGLREGKFLPGRLLADALQDVEQYSEDEIRGARAVVVKRMNVGSGTAWVLRGD